jgi:hypothetical protein
MPLTIGAFGTLLWLERRRPLRRAVKSKARREVRNLSMAAVSGLVLRFLERPVVEPLTRRVERDHLETFSTSTRLS